MRSHSLNQSAHLCYEHRLYYVYRLLWSNFSIWITLFNIHIPVHKSFVFSRMYTSSICWLPILNVSVGTKGLEKLRNGDVFPVRNRSCTWDSTWKVNDFHLGTEPWRECGTYSRMLCALSFLQLPVYSCAALGELSNHLSCFLHFTNETNTTCFPLTVRGKGRWYYTQACLAQRGDT